MGEVEVEGLRIAFERAGSGPPLVLVNGFVGDGRSTFASQLDALSDEYTVVAWDAPGAGGSSDPPDWFRISDYARCLVGFIEALGIDRPHLLGLSFGGAVILEAFRQRPTLARSLVLAGAYAGWAGSLAPEAVQQRLEFCLRVADLPAEEFAAAMVPSMFSRSVAPPTVAAFAASVRAVHRAGFLAMTWASAEADLREMLPTVNVPCLLIFGDADARAPLPVGQALHAAIPGSELIILPGVGHVSPVEAPEPFNASLRNFLASANCAPGGRLTIAADLPIS